VNNYIPADTDGGAAAPAEDPAAQQATKLFDEGLALFKTGDYHGALAKFDVALQKLPGDPVIHEVRAVTLFALGEYTQSAAALNSFLSSAPGMDWTTMSSLYGNIQDYETQLRQLEAHCKANPTDASAYFVLAYQYLVTGAKDAAVDALRVVVKNQPRDSTAKRMLDGLAPPEPIAAAKPPAETTPAGTTPAEADGPQTDLVGTWQAKADGTTIELTIAEDSKFTWKATPAGKPPVNLSGELSSSSSEVVLNTAEQGAMAGTVKSLGADKWQFMLSGAPASDPGLTFQRVK